MIIYDETHVDKDGNLVGPARDGPDSSSSDEAKIPPPLMRQAGGSGYRLYSRLRDIGGISPVPSIRSTVITGQTEGLKGGFKEWVGGWMDGWV
jgi:hypothetical protein